MTQEEKIKDYFIHQFWPIYPGKWCRSGKGGRGEAMNAFLKKKKEADPEELRRILENLKAQIRADKGNPDRKWWVIGKTYCNNESWEDPVEDDLEPEGATSYCKCGQPVDHKGYMECWTCYERRTTKENRQDQKMLLKDLGLYKEGQSLREVSQNCRQWLSERKTSGIPLVKTLKDL